MEEVDGDDPLMSARGADANQILLIETEQAVDENEIELEVAKNRATLTKFTSI